MDKKVLTTIIIIIALLATLLASTSLQKTGNNTSIENSTGLNNTTNVSVDGQYVSKDDVASYIKLYHKLPSNYITKKEAQDLGWQGGPLKSYAPGKSIGGDVFTNRQGVLPRSDKKYIECDIDANGTQRGAKRIVYSTDNYKVYYTEDHYNTFTEI